jgi:hypothetical protein
VTPQQFRLLALACPGAVEGEHQAHPDFRCRGRIFASLHQDGLRAMVKVPLPVQQRMVANAVGAAVPATGAWGRAGCTMLELKVLSREDAAAALLEAWQLAQLASATKAVRKTPAPKQPAPERPAPKRPPAKRSPPQRPSR